MSNEEFWDEVKKKHPDVSDDEWRLTSFIFTWAWMKIQEGLTDEEFFELLGLAMENYKTLGEFKKRVEARKKLEENSVKRLQEEPPQEGWSYM